MPIQKIITKQKTKWKWTSKSTRLYKKYKNSKV